MPMIEETWKPIPIQGYENLYQVSSSGRVKSNDRIDRLNRKRKGIILSPDYDKEKYLSVCLCDNGKNKRVKLHRVVALAFIPNSENKKEVNHKDGDKSNNCVHNLEWATRRENAIHGHYVLKTVKAPLHPKGESHPNNKPVFQFSLDGKLIREYKSITLASIAVTKNTSAEGSGSITNVCRRKKGRKIAYGFMWSYKTKLLPEDAVPSKSAPVANM